MLAPLSIYNETIPHYNPYLVYTPPQSPLAEWYLYPYDAAHPQSYRVLERLIREVLPYSNPLCKYRTELPNLTFFISSFISSHRLLNIHILLIMVYLKRLQYYLPANAKGGYDTLHRIFLACVILSAKYYNDILDLSITPGRVSKWTAGLFNTADVSSMEFDFMKLVNYDLHVHACDLTNLLEELQQQTINCII
ncbi:hypothetical protein ROZALSC1DRAFT_27383 [Rozella allomycis CSF55]|uniref:Uncharacterized protein n=1 Tax=Rozella allomycis (strain CSF55) TaxID=988480 RepID=A0A075B172_ROZAC|nr:hypothetical protein O9G_003439 [Rozella allomycis CSF55]RKP21184.1 hypothetical protein ROZALSC1DRAFT_27383 [Rozella allomycis CSF55]|eukprot:EPZ36281.1 hypothetical protein O9G_003439 [Rozella allomycis CSF55]